MSKRKNPRKYRVAVYRRKQDRDRQIREVEQIIRLRELDRERRGV